MTAQRILAVLAAVLFVGAVALATVSKQMVSMGAVVSFFSASGVQDLHNWLVRVPGVWAWIWVAQPLLIRPAWLPVGSLGLLLAGVALSWPTRDAARRSHRRS